MTEGLTLAMLDRRSRVTVVGTTKRVDVALPSNAPIGEYVAGLARMCGQARGGAIPPAWSLAAAGRAPIQVETSLADAGVVDGQILYLRDVARDPGAAPVVEDIDELVADEAERQRDRSQPRGLAIMSFGLMGLTMAAAVGAVRHGDGLVTPAVALIAAGLAAVATGWALHQLHTPVPATLRVAASMSAVPCLAVAGGLLAQALAGQQALWLGVIVGANVANVMALTTVPDAFVVAFEVPLAAAGALAALLYGLDTEFTRTAITAAIAVTALALVGIAKPVAAIITAWGGRIPPGGPAMAEATTAMLVRGRQIVAVLLVGPVLALVATLPQLAEAHERMPYAPALAGVAGLALLVRTRRAGFAAEVILIGVAGSVGVFAVLVEIFDRYLGEGVAVFALAAVALLVLGWGITATIMRQPGLADRDAEPTLGGPPETPDRYRWVDGVGMLCNIAAASLAMGVFGVFDELLSMGRGIIG